MSIKSAQLVWRDIRYEVNTGKGQRQILQGIDGHVEPGHMLSIIGSSGAGKTSLLNVLGGRIRAGEVRGSFKVNGVPMMDRAVFKEIAAYVTQDDLMLETQTCRELLMFNAHLRLPKKTTHETKVEKVNQLLEILGIQKIADSIVGSPLSGGISGGERKRVHIGMELVTEPSVLFCDEPTSGLDSYTALEVVRLLKSLSQAGRTILFTIHQPSTDIYHEFDDLLVLTNGRAAYFGHSLNVVEYFSSLGFHKDVRHNESEFVLDCIIGQDRRQSAVVNFPEAYAKSALALQHVAQPAVGLTPLDSMQIEPRPGFGTQFVALCGRSFRNYLRDRVGLRARMMQTIFFAVLLALVFADIKRSREGVADRQGILFFSVLSMGLTSLMQAALMFPLEKNIFSREHADGTYTITAYFLGKTTAEAPFQFLFPLLFTVIFYFAVDLRSGADHFFLMAITLILVALTAQSLGLLVGSVAPKPELAPVLVPIFFIPFTLMSGFIANRDRLNPYWIWLERVSFMAYGYESLMHNEMQDQCFFTNATCETLKVTDPATWVLVDGNQVLERFHFRLTVATCIFALIGLMVGFRLIAYLALRLQLRQRTFTDLLNQGQHAEQQPPQPPQPLNQQAPLPPQARGTQEMTQVPDGDAASSLVDQVDGTGKGDGNGEKILHRVTIVTEM